MIVVGNGGNVTGSGNFNDGITIVGTSSKIASSGGNISVAGTARGATAGASSFGAIGVQLSSGQIEGVGSGTVTVVGFGGNLSGAASGNHGVLVTGSTAKITSAGGDVSVSGTGGGFSGTGNMGVRVEAEGQINTVGAGHLNVTGMGGASSGHMNYGVFVTGSTNSISSGNGNVEITGTGGGLGASSRNHGIRLENSASLSSTGTGEVILVGQGGNSTGAGDTNYGVSLDGNSAGIVATNNGNISITGFGGTSGSGGNDGVSVGKGVISAGGAGMVTIQGTGGDAGSVGIGARGVTFLGPSQINTVSGDILVSGTSLSGSGVVLGADSVHAGGTGDIVVTGTGGVDSLRANTGVVVISDLTTEDGDISVTSVGGPSSNRVGGVEVYGTLSAGGTGDVTIYGAGGIGNAPAHFGALVNADSISAGGGHISITGIASGPSTTHALFGVDLGSTNYTGNVTVLGTGGNGPGWNEGVAIDDAITVSGNLIINGFGGDGGDNSNGVGIYGNITSSGLVTITGTAGSGDNNLIGVSVYLATVSSSTGVVITGTGGAGSGTSNDGVELREGLVEGTGSATITMIGTGGSGSDRNFGVDLETLTGGMRTVNGNIFVQGTAGSGTTKAGIAFGVEAPLLGYSENGGFVETNGTGNVALVANQIIINADSTIVASTVNSVTITQQTNGHAIALGGSDSISTLGLTDAELDRIAAGTIRIGNVNSGEIELRENLNRASSTNWELIAGTDRDIHFETFSLSSAGDVSLTTSGSGAIRTGDTIGPDIIGDDVTLNAGSGGIGSTSNFLRLAATTVTATTSGNGSINLVGSSSVNIGANGLNAGTGTITLGGGTFLTSNAGTPATTDDSDILSPVTVTSGATLGGTGMTSAVSIQSGGNVAPGTSPGTLNTGNVTLVSGSNFNVEIGGTAGAASGHDQLNVTGTVDLGGANLVLTLGYTPANGDSFVIVNNDSTDAVTGTFTVGNNSIADGDSFTVSGTRFVIDYTSGSDSNDITLTVNTPPTLTNAIADQNATEDSAFSFAFAADTFADVDGVHTLTYSTSSLPSWLNFSDSTRTFSGTPTNADVGFVDVTVTATDLGGAAISDTFRISVANTNNRPTLDHAIADQSATINSPFSFTFAANTFGDVDAGDSLTYSTSSLPSWLSFTPETRTFAGTPTNADVGFVDVTVTATDLSNTTASDTFRITIAQTVLTVTLTAPEVVFWRVFANEPKITVAASLGSTRVANGNGRIEFDFNNDGDFNDPNDVLGTTFSEPGGPTFRLDQNGEITFTLSLRSTAGGVNTGREIGPGTYRFRAVVVDSTGRTGVSAISELRIVDLTFTAMPIPDQIVRVGAPFEFVVDPSTFTFTNPLSNASVPISMVWSATLSNGARLPSWLSFDSATRTFSGQPSEVGMFDIKVVATRPGNPFLSPLTDMFRLSVVPDLTLTVPEYFSFSDFVPLATPKATVNATGGATGTVFIDLDANLDGDFLDNVSIGGSGVTTKSTMELRFASGTLVNGSATVALARTQYGVTRFPLPGTYRIRAKFRDAVGNESVSATSTLTIVGLVTPIPDQTAFTDQPFSVTPNPNTFYFGSASSSVVYSARRADGQPLPNWLRVDSATGMLTGIPPEAATGDLDVQFMASALGLSATDVFRVTVVDRTSPQVTLVAPTVTNGRTAPINVTVNATDLGAGLRSAFIKIDVDLNNDGDFADIVGGRRESAFQTSTLETNVTSNTIQTFSPFANLNNGTYRVRARVRDAAGNVGTSNITTTQVNSAATNLDSTPPTTAITTIHPVITNATSVSFQVSFTKAVTGISTDDFQIFSSNVSNPPAGTIASVSSNSAASGVPVTVVVNQISGAGSLRLGLKGSTNIVDTAGNSARAQIGPSIEIDQALPTVNIDDVSPDPRTNAIPATHFLYIKFNEVVTGVTRDTFRLTRNGVPVDLSLVTFIDHSSLTQSIYSLFGPELTNATNAVGVYRLSFSSIAGITDRAGNPLLAADVEEWEFVGTQVTNINGVIRIQDVADASGFSNDNFTLSIDPQNADNILLTDGQGRRTSIPIAGATTLAIDGTGGDDIVTLDFVNGALPFNIIYDGGFAGNDVLVVRNAASFGLLNMTYDNVTDGSLQFTVGGMTRTLLYLGLEPITITDPPAELVFNLPNTSDPDVTLSMVGGMMRLAGSTFELTDFDPAGVTGITINGNGGHDFITVGDLGSYSGTLTINGGTGNDRINASAATIPIRLIGDSGNDTLTGGGGDDILRGGVGNDVLSGGDGTDSREELLFGKRITLTNTLSVFGNDTVTSMERVEVIGDNNHNLIDASGYTLGPITIRGGAGNDTLIGSSASDLLDGGQGMDVAQVRASGDMNLTGEADAATINSSAGTDELQNIERVHLIGSGGANVLDASGFSGDTTLEGGEGNDTLRGGSGINLLNGHAGRDSLIGGDSADTLLGGDGNDILDGRGGNDFLSGQAGGDTLRGGTGDDRLKGEKGNDLIFGGSGQDLIDGGDESDILVGESGHDTITGGNGSDSISGGLGDDQLNGGAGSDVILGDDGADLLTSGGGSDRLSGGRGNDRFVATGAIIATGDGDDTVTGSNNHINEAFTFDFDRLLI